MKRISLFAAVILSCAGCEEFSVKEHVGERGVAGISIQNPSSELKFMGSVKYKTPPDTNFIILPGETIFIPVHSGASIQMKVDGGEKPNE